MSGEKSDKPHKSEPIDDDNLVMNSLVNLVECENATRHDPQGFIKYKVRVKEVLEILLSKLERNHLYEKYLETEIEEFEDRIISSTKPPGVDVTNLEEMGDNDIPAIPTDERIDSADSVEVIHRHTVAELQDTIRDLRLKQFNQAQAYEDRIEQLEHQLNEREADMVDYTLRKEKELALAGAVLASLRRKIDTIGYNIAVRSNLPYPPPRVLSSANGNGHANGSGSSPQSPLSQYVLGSNYTTKELLALDEEREHFLSQFEQQIEEEESYYEGENNGSDYVDGDEDGGVYEEGDGESVEGEGGALAYKNQLLERYDLEDEELSLEEEQEEEEIELEMSGHKEHNDEKRDEEEEGGNIREDSLEPKEVEEEKVEMQQEKQEKSDSTSSNIGSNETVDIPPAAINSESSLVDDITHLVSAESVSVVA